MDIVKVYVPRVRDSRDYRLIALPLPVLGTSEQKENKRERERKRQRVSSGRAEKRSVICKVNLLTMSNEATCRVPIMWHG